MLENEKFLEDLSCSAPAAASAEVLQALRSDDRFAVYLRGVRVLLQMTENLREALQVFDCVDSEFSMDFGSLLHEVTLI